MLFSGGSPSQKSCNQKSLQSSKTNSGTGQQRNLIGTYLASSVALRSPSHTCGKGVLLPENCHQHVLVYSPHQITGVPPSNQPETHFDMNRREEETCDFCFYAKCRLRTPGLLLRRNKFATRFPRQSACTPQRCKRQ